MHSRLVNRCLSKLSSLPIGFCIGAVLLSGCGDSEVPPPVSSIHPKLSVMMIQFGADTPEPDSPVQTSIEAYTGLTLDMTWVPATSYDDKVSATLASGKLPEVMLLRRNKEQASLNAQQSGLFWNLAPFLEDTVHLKHMSRTALDNAMIDGKLYGIPRERVIARYGIIFRKDWLDRLGLAVPASVEDIYNTAKAITERDPDGNGQPDTFGIEESKSLESLKQLAVYLGAPNGWGWEEGKLQPDFLHPAYKQALDLMRRMYSEKLINPDFPIAPKYSYFNQGKAGMYFSVLGDAVSKTDTKKLNPDAVEVIDVVQNINGPLGQRVRATNGYDSLLVIPKAGAASEQEVRRIIQFFDKLGDPPMQDLLNWGLEGIDYVMENGTPRKLPGTIGAGDYWSFKWDDPVAGMQGIKTQLEEKVDRLAAQNEVLAIPDLSAPLISATNYDVGKELDTGLYNAKVNYILGVLDEEGWNEAISSWRQNGGDRMMDELTAAYRKTVQLK
ncbi:extracellular solute-binding protein [Paenibacillus puerhi]|uniref:extracellular solute-binding protein n=1 Tax=Paenibacillus puerhi TaxID=2692622 RepID=UPI001359D882|nr:extracellular solute-binding protein [Paenibacillus puerhi]